MALDAGVGTIVLDNARGGAAAGRAARRPLASACCCASRPGVDADTHEAILTGQAGSKFGFAPDDARALMADPPAGIEIAGLHMHLGSQLFALEPYRRAIGALATLGEFGVYDLGGGLGVPYTAGDPVLDVEAWVHGMVEAAHAELGPDRTLVLEPGRALVASAGVTLYRVESVKPGAAGELLVAVDGGMSDNLRPMLYGAAYEAHVVTRMGEEGVASHGGRQALRVRRRARARRRSCPSRAPATCSSRPRPAPTATRWPTTTTASRDRRWCSAPAGARAWSCAARPTRSCMAARRLSLPVGLLGHGTVGAAFEALLAERADAVAATTGPAARAQRRAHPLARRLRGDPRGRPT